MSAPVDADAVWAVLESIGWTQKIEDAYGGQYWSPTRGHGNSVYVHVRRNGDSIDIHLVPNQSAESRADIAPALAALSRLLGGDA